MAAFAVQAVTQVFERASAWRLERRRAQVGIGGNMSEAVIPHSRLLENARKKWEGQHSVDNNMPPKTSADDEKSGASDAITMAANGDDDQHAVDAAMEDATQAGKEEGNMQRRQSMSEADTDAAEHHALYDSEKLAREVIERAVELESIARRMMVRALPDGSRAQILLRADRAVQAHDVRALVHAGGASGANSDDDRRSDPQLGFGGKQEDIGTFRQLLNSGIEEDDELLRPLEDEETLEEVERYRACFAALLFAGGRLRKLEGIQMALLERRPYPHPNYDN
jgi:potassium channel subfamily K, other eukaryote